MNSGALAQRIGALRAQIDAELRSCGRAPGSVTLVGVSKKQPAAAIAEAAEAGLGDIGENYVQEAQQKFPELRSSSLRRHFIGHVQTNKARSIVELFDLVQTVDRFGAAEALAKAAERAGKVLPVLMQLNVSPSERYGCEPSGAPALAEQIRGFGSLRLEGVMAIGPVSSDSAEIVRAFETAAMTLSRVGGSTLSIGMSADWREAIRAGSTMLRIGTAIFGARPAATILGE